MESKVPIDNEPPIARKPDSPDRSVRLVLVMVTSPVTQTTPLSSARSPAVSVASMSTSPV
jgi:hypothetical protein